MLKTGVICSGINIMRQTQLPDASESLKIGMFEKIKNNFKWQAYETIHRIVDDLLLVYWNFTQGFKSKFLYLPQRLRLSFSEGAKAQRH